MRIEFSPHGFGGVRWLPPFPSIELGGPSPELKPYGRARVVEVNHFSELKGRRGALLKWAYHDKKGYRSIVAIGKHKGYLPGTHVQIMMFTQPDQDALFYARIMAKGNDLWGPDKLTPVTEKLLKLLRPVYSFKIAEK